MSQEIPVPFSSLDVATTIVDKEILIGNGDILERISLTDFASFFQMLNKIAKPISPSETAPTVIGWYSPKISASDPGTSYPNLTPAIDENGNSIAYLKARNGYDTLFYYNGTVWTKKESKYSEIAPNIRKLSEITSNQFPLPAGSQVIYENGFYIVAEGQTAASTDLPGQSHIWVKLNDIKTTDIPAGKNKFNKDKVVPNQYVVAGLGVITTVTGPSNFKTTEPIKVNPGGPVAVSGLPEIHNALGYIWTAADKTTKVGNSYINADVKSASLTAPANGEYLILTVNSSKAGEIYNGDTIQIEIGSSPTTYEAYIPLITQINDHYLTVEKVETNILEDKSPVNYKYLKDNTVLKSSFSKETGGKNLFNPDEAIPGYIDINTSARMPASNYVRTPPIPIKPAAIYVSGVSNVHNALGWRINDANDVVLAKGYPAGNATEFLIDASPYPTAKTVDITLKTGKTGDTYNPGQIQIEYGGAKTAYEPYREVITAINGMGLKSDSGGTESKVKTEGLEAAVLGDSNTATAGESGTPVPNWPMVAFPLLGATFTNYALSGAHIEDFETTSPRRKLSVQITDMINSGVQYDFIVISIGINSLNVLDNDYELTMSKSLNDLDITKVMDAMRINFRRVAEAFPNAVLFYGTPMQAIKSGDANEQLTQRKVINQFKLMAQTFNFKIIDAFEEVGIVRDFEVKDAMGRYLKDGLHCNTAGIERHGKYYANQIIIQYP